MFKDEYQAAFSKVTASEETYRRVMSMTRRESRRISNAAKLALIAAMAVLLVACAAVFDAGAMLEAVFGENGRGTYEYEEFTYKGRNGREVTRFRFAGERSALDTELARELVEPYVFEVNQTAASGDYTMTVLSCLHDPVTGTGIVYLTLENPNGFPDMHIWNDGEVSWHPEEGGTKWILYPEPLGLFYIDDAMTTDTKLYLTCNYVSIFDEREMTISFMDTEEKVTFQLPEESGMNHLSLANGDILLSPVGFSCNNTRFNVLYIAMPTITIRYEDGTEAYIIWHDPYQKKHTGDRTPIKDPIQNYVMAPELTNDPRTHKSYLLNFIVDIDHVRSVVINDEEFFVR